MKGTKAYVLRSLLPPKCRAIVKGPNVHHGLFMLVLSLIDFSPSKKIPAGELGIMAIDIQSHTQMRSAAARVSNMAMASLRLPCAL